MLGKGVVPPRKIILSFFIACLITSPAAYGKKPVLVPETPAVSPQESDAIQKMLQSYVKKGDAVGNIIGLISPAGKSIIAAGHISEDSRIQPDGDTFFEVGSISKIFTLVLFEDEVERGRMGVNDPIIQYFPSDMPFPKRKKVNVDFSITYSTDKQVTLLNMANHTSGFPRDPEPWQMPHGWNPKDPSNVSLEMMKDFLGRFTFDRDPGEKFEYSNLNIALLGYAIACREKIDFDQLLNQRVIQPLGLKDSHLSLTSDQELRMASGYTQWGAVSPPIHPPVAFAGTGSLKSTVNDLLKFEQYELEMRPTPLAKVIKDSRDLAFEMIHNPLGDALVMNGRTLGFTSLLVMVPGKKMGVVILGNSVRFDVYDVALSLLKILTTKN